VHNGKLYQFIPLYLVSNIVSYALNNGITWKKILKIINSRRAEIRPTEIDIYWSDIGLSFLLAYKLQKYFTKDL